MLLVATILLLVTTMVLGWLCFHQRRRFRIRLAEVELRQLRTQLNPHFLFNTLNAISELGYDDPAAADRAITQLSGVLRKSLDQSERQEISLKSEIDFLDDYLSLQRMLMRDKLDVAVSIEPRLLRARVPAMILQPLVENALYHGRNPEGASSIGVSAALAGEMLVIEVRDDGPGLQSDTPATGRPGIGVANVRARLKHLYGNSASVALHNGEAGGAIARISLPYHELP